MSGTADALREALGPDAVAAGEAALAAHALDGVQPQAVAHPGSPEQVAELLALAAARRWAVVPWGSGSGMGRGRPPTRYDVALTLGRLAAVRDHDADNLTLVADAGLSLAEANRQLAPRHQMLAIGHTDAANTLGGIVAANRTAPRRLLYGEVRDQLLGLRVAMADGTLVRFGRKVLKNVAGYDMNKLFLGSQGMLGVVVETTFKLFALPDESRTLLATFARAEDAALAAGALFRSQLLPALLHLLEPGAAAQLPGGAAVADGGLALVVGFEGRAVAVQRQVADGQALLRQHGAAEVTEMERLEPAFRQVLDAPGAAAGRPADVRLRLGVVPTAVPFALEQARALAADLNMPATAVADYAAGHVHAALSWTDGVDEPSATRTAQAVADLRARLEAERGWLALEAGPALLKARLDPLGSAPGEVRLMRTLRARFDPAELMAPGRYLPEPA